jgi:hypothetical protein
MNLDYGLPIDTACTEVEAGVFERRFENITVRLNCSNWVADFVPTVAS